MNTEKPQYNTARDCLKIIAIIAMTADHTSTVFLNEGSELYSICQFFGNFTIVIMSFFITQELRYTRSVLKYAERLLLWAVISEIPFYLLFGLQLNVLFTLLASLTIIYLLDSKGLLIALTALALFFPDITDLRLEYHCSRLHNHLLCTPEKTERTILTHPDTRFLFHAQDDSLC